MSAPSATARPATSPAADGDLEPGLARQLDGVGDVGRAVAAGDERGPPIDQPVVDSASLVVADIGCPEQ
jgi:hypothetical protein